MLLVDNTHFVGAATQVYEFDDTDVGPKARLVGFAGTNSPGSGPYNSGGNMKIIKVMYHTTTTP